MFMHIINDIIFLISFSSLLLLEKINYFFILLETTLLYLPLLSIITFTFSVLPIKSIRHSYFCPLSLCLTHLFSF